MSLYFVNFKEPPKPSEKIKPPSPKKKVFKSPRSADRPRDRRSFTVLDSGKKSLRKSTAAKSAATQHRVKERVEAEKKKPKVVRADDYIPTQEELLEEAETTEKENLVSLEKFRRMELEKKKTRPTKSQHFTGPIIRYHSVSMPVLIEELDEAKRAPIKKEVVDETEVIITTDKNETKRTTRRSRMAANDAAKVIENNRCERTFITFTNDINGKVFDSVFHPPPTKKHRSQTCAITKLPAKYFDPITQLPYRNIMAFKILRESYYQMLEATGDVNDPQVATWLEWRKKSKESRAKLNVNIKIE